MFIPSEWVSLPSSRSKGRTKLTISDSGDNTSDAELYASRVSFDRGDLNNDADHHDDFKYDIISWIRCRLAEHENALDPYCIILRRPSRLPMKRENAAPDKHPSS